MGGPAMRSVSQGKPSGLKAEGTMDDRQRQIKEGAGLEESRINKDFLDWLLKWGPVLVLVAAGIILAMRGVQFLEDRRVARVNEGFSELERVSEGVTVNPN